MSDPRSAREVFEGLPGSLEPAELAGLEQRYRFDIAGEGSWVVAVSGGAVEVHEAEPGEQADAVISTSGEVFAALVAGRLNPMSAFLRGKIKVSGDMGAALKLQRLFRA